MLENCDFILIFPIYGQFGAIEKPYPRTSSIKFLLSVIVAFRPTKTENRSKKSLSSNTTLTVRSCHATYAFQSESTLYSCLNVNELLARNSEWVEWVETVG